MLCNIYNAYIYSCVIYFYIYYANFLTFCFFVDFFQFTYILCSSLGTFMLDIFDIISVIIWSIVQSILARNAI